MYYSKKYPSDCLKPFVNCYFVWRSSGPLPQSLIIESPPSGYTALVLNFGDTHYLISGNSKIKIPHFFIAGQSTHRYNLLINGRIDMIGVVFKPIGLHHLLKIPINELTDKRVELDILLKDGWDELIHKISLERTEFGKLSKMEEYLKKKILPEYSTDFIDLAANLMESEKGLVRINRVSQDLNISGRNLQKKFLSKVGVTPKNYCRIRRLGYICHLLTSGKELDWQDIIYLGGYFDQAHFIKEFKQFMNRTPGIYASDNHELVKYL